jgi:hypothetical protein
MIYIVILLVLLQIYQGVQIRLLKEAIRNQQEYIKKMRGALEMIREHINTLFTFTSKKP